VDKAYRNLPGAGFVAHDTIIKQLRLFKDGVGRYMWQPAYVLGQPDTILGYPLNTNNDMDSALTTGKKLLGFGHAASAHVIRDAGATRFVRTDEKYVLEHQVAFLAWQRGSSETVDTTAFKVLTLS
jgi:HK97 family phage major capsid protein